MKLNHLNLVVSDIAPAVHFFVTYFGFTCTSIKGDNIIAILSGEDDFTLVIMTSKEADRRYPAAFHIGFMQDSREEILAVYTKLKDDGIDIGREPQSIRGGYGFYFHFDEILIEVGLAGT